MTATLDQPQRHPQREERGYASLSPSRRKTELARVERDGVDVLVVGGGVTGAGVALDAASRGLSVALVEKRDLAAGTSSRSTKLVHGGLRYLEQLEFGLVREALHERRLLLRELAPHLVRPVPFLLPLKHRAWERAYMGAGVLLYDVLSGARSTLPRHRHLSLGAALRLAPGLSPDHLVGGLGYYDAQVDDARLVVSVARTAAGFGAAILPGVAVTRFTESDGRVTGALVRDSVLGTEHTLRSRVVVNATGVWTTELERLAGVPRPLEVTASKGVHLMLRRSAIDSERALIVRTESSVLLVIPWADYWIVGTTDTPYDLGRDHPAATSTDIAYLLEQVNQVLARPVTRSDVVGVYVGLRPLVSPASAREQGATTRISREHVVRRSRPGFVTIAGGKYTTYRVMARDAVDAAATELDEPIDASSTQHLPLAGARGLALARVRLPAHPGAAYVTPAGVSALVGRYGSLAGEVLDLVRDEPALGRSLAGAEGYLRAEAVHAVRREGALRVDDVLTRRTHISVEAADHGRAAVADVAHLMGAELGWTPEQIEQEIKRYRDRLDAEDRAHQAHSEARAEQERGRVTDPRLT